MKAIAVSMGIILIAVIYISSTTVIAQNHHDANADYSDEGIIGQESLKYL